MIHSLGDDFGGKGGLIDRFHVADYEACMRRSIGIVCVRQADDGHGLVDFVEIEAELVFSTGRLEQEGIDRTLRAGEKPMGLDHAKSDGVGGDVFQIELVWGSGSSLGFGGDGAVND